VREQYFLLVSHQSAKLCNSCYKGSKESRDDQVNVNLHEHQKKHENNFRSGRFLLNFLCDLGLTPRPEEVPRSLQPEAGGELDPAYSRSRGGGFRCFRAVDEEVRFQARRVAILRKNFSPADNRNIPPLHYEHVYQLKRDFPHLVISLNGGVDSLSEALDVFENCPEVSERSERPCGRL